MKYVVAGVLAVLAAAGATLLASRRVAALTDLTRPVLSGTTLAAVAFAVAGLAVVGGVALLTAPSRRAAPAAPVPPSGATGPTPVTGTDVAAVDPARGPEAVAEPEPLTEPLTIPAIRTSAPAGAAPVISRTAPVPPREDAPAWAGSTTPSRHAAVVRVPSWSGRG